MIRMGQGHDIYMAIYNTYTHTFIQPGGPSSYLCTSGGSAPLPSLSLAARASASPAAENTRGAETGLPRSRAAAEPRNMCLL